MLSGNGVEVIRGTAKLTGPDSVEVETLDGENRTLQAGRILLATGSEPVRVGNIPVDGKRIVDSTDALSFTEVPRHLVVVGGGYIGLELGSVWRRLGAKVTVVEMLPRIAAAVDGQVARSLDRLLRKQGFEFRMKTKVENAEVDDDRVRVSLSGETGSETLECDRVLVAVGRRPLTSGLELSSVGVETDEKTGHVRIDGEYKTSVDSIYAIGDLVPGPMLAHKASAEGIAAVECMAGKPGEVNYDAVPSVIYTYPEVAAVGMTEETLKERGIRYCSGTYPFSGAGRARCMGETDGFVKILAHEASDRILGIHIIGPRAADMIAEGVLAVEFQAGAEDVSRTIHGHPTFAETLMEAAMAIRKCSIYGG
jgi:dihydrolipoamide dehydrogenase